MSRSQQNQVFQTGQANNKQDQGNAQTAFTGAEKGIDDFNSRLGTYYSQDPYQKGGEFEQDQKTINASGANANANALQNEFNLTGKRSGESTASFAPNLVKAQQQGVMDASTNQAKSNAQQLENETRYQQYGLDASKFPVQAQTQIQGQNLSAANGALGTAESAAKQPSGWDMLWEQAINGAQKGAAAAAGA